jgi:hypothetical protein
MLPNLRTFHSYREIEGGRMTDQSPTMMRCERCRAVLCSADAPAMIRAGTPCGVCGGVLMLARAHGHGASHADHAPAPSPERRRSTAASSPRRDVLPRAR